MVNETYPSGRIVTNNFETDGDLAQVSGSFQGNAKTYVGNFTYTSAGAVSSLQLGNGKWENTVFNSRLQPTQIGLGSSANAQDLWKVNYDYGNADNNGNVKSQTITVPSQFTAIQNYDYDSLNRLKSANETISGSQTWKQTFTFDRYGNRKFDASQTTTLGNCPVNVCNPDISVNNNRVVGHSFDNSGNTTVDGEGKTFFYDAENKQKEVRDASNNIIGQYLYDGDGKRVKKILANDTTIFVYDAGGKLASEYLITASQSQAPTTSYLTNDTLGSPRVVTDNSGNVTSRRDFLPFGEEIYRAGQGSDKVRQKFTSYERDNETELDFAQARMYANKLGRFTSVDTFGGIVENPQSFNRYSYVLNMPLVYNDPTGNTWETPSRNGGDKSSRFENAQIEFMSYKEWVVAPGCGCPEWIDPAEYAKDPSKHKLWDSTRLSYKSTAGDVVLDPNSANWTLNGVQQLASPVINPVPTLETADSNATTLVTIGPFAVSYGKDFVSTESPVGGRKTPMRRYGGIGLNYGPPFFSISNTGNRGNTSTGAIIQGGGCYILCLGGSSTLVDSSGVRNPFSSFSMNGGMGTPSLSGQIMFVGELTPPNHNRYPPHIEQQLKRYHPGYPR